jgi:hypothetical protein
MYLIFIVDQIHQSFNNKSKKISFGFVKKKVLVVNERKAFLLKYPYHVMVYSHGILN